MGVVAGMRDLGTISARGKRIDWKDPAQRKAYKKAYNKAFGHGRRGSPMKDNTFATLEEIAKQLGVTKERVRQIEKEALRKLRVALEARGVKDVMVPRGESNWERIESCGDGE